MPQESPIRFVVLSTAEHEKDGKSKLISIQKVPIAHNREDRLSIYP
jgi:hypothetical protein